MSQIYDYSQGLLLLTQRPDFGVSAQSNAQGKLLTPHLPHTRLPTSYTLFPVPC